MPGSSRRRRSTRPLGIVLAVVLLAGMGVMLFRLADGPEKGLSPHETVQRVVDALEEGDCGEAKKYARRLDDSVCEAVENGEVSFESVSDGEIVDETAAVYVKVQRSDAVEEGLVKVDLVNWDDLWEILDGTDLTDPPPGPPCADGDPACD